MNEVTAGAGDILSGKTANNSDGDVMIGTMANNGAWSGRVNPGESVTVPAGYHNGSGKVYATTEGVKNIKTKTVSSGDVNGGSYTYNVTEGTLIGVTNLRVNHWYESNSAVVNYYISDNTIHVDTAFAGGTFHDISFTFAYY